MCALKHTVTISDQSKALLMQQQIKTRRRIMELGPSAGKHVFFFAPIECFHMKSRQQTANPKELNGGHVGASNQSSGS